MKWYIEQTAKQSDVWFKFGAMVQVKPWKKAFWVTAWPIVKLTIIED